MNKLDLYKLPKDILVKLICDIQENTRNNIIKEQYERSLKNLEKIRIIDPEYENFCKKVIKCLHYEKFVTDCEIMLGLHSIYIKIPNVGSHIFITNINYISQLLKEYTFEEFKNEWVYEYD